MTFTDYYREDPVCPYCEASVEINHDDGYGYDESGHYEQECHKCDKTFAFMTCMSFSYKTNKADCLNGAQHQMRKVTHSPKHWPNWYRCQDCDKEDRGEFIEDPE